MPTQPRKPTEGPRPDGGDAPSFVTDDWLSARLRRLELAARSLETGAASIRHQLAHLAGALERGLGYVPERERTIADLTDDELTAAFPGSAIEHSPTSRA